MDACAGRLDDKEEEDRWALSHVEAALDEIGRDENSIGRLQPVQRIGRLQPVQCMGGGGQAAEQVEAQLDECALKVALAIRKQLGEIVNSPGLKAIKAVLFMRATGAKQKDAILHAGTSKASVQKYAPLVDKVLTTAVVHSVPTDSGASGATGVADETVAATVLPPVFRALPQMSDIRLSSETISPDDNLTYRVWKANVRAEDGSFQERETLPVRHEPAVANETPEDRRKREHREHDRIFRALRALDPISLAAGRAKDRDRKRATAALRASQLPALPHPDGDPVWWRPAAEQPHFVGEQVWHSTSELMVKPQLVVIRQLYRDGSADLQLAGQDVMLRSRPDDQLRRVGATLPCYVGQRVEIEAARRGQTPGRQLATIIKVHEGPTFSELGTTADVQLYDGASRAYNGPIYTRIRVCDESTRKQVDKGVKVGHARMGLLQDLARPLCEHAMGILSGSSDASESDDDASESDDMFESDDDRKNERGAAAFAGWAQRGRKRQSTHQQSSQCAVCSSVSWCSGNKCNGSPPPRIRSMMEHAKTPEQRARLADHRRQGPNWVGPGLHGVCLASSCGPQLFRSPGMPICRLIRNPACCPKTDTHHFDMFDHPPDEFGDDHPYIAVAKAEAAGADMTRAREILCELATAADEHLVYPSYGDLEMNCVAGDLSSLEILLHRATHVIYLDPLHQGHPGGEWASLHEALQGRGDSCTTEPEDAVRLSQSMASLDAERRQLLDAATANNEVVAQKQLVLQPRLAVWSRVTERCSLPPPVAQPKFMRVAQRMRQWREKGQRQTRIDWGAIKQGRSK
jgi:hypothetical protein